MSEVKTLTIEQNTMVDFTSKAFDIANTLDTLHAALPDDSRDAEFPTRCMVAMLARMANALAIQLMDAS